MNYGTTKYFLEFLLPENFSAKDNIIEIRLTLLFHFQHDIVFVILCNKVLVFTPVESFLCK